MTNVLTWEKAPRARTPEEWASYEPHTDSEWKLKWKARLLGQKEGLTLRVVIHKSTDDAHAGPAEVKITVFEDGAVIMSMGTAGFSREEFWELNTGVSEAISAMQLWRTNQRGVHLSERSMVIVMAATESGDDG